MTTVEIPLTTYQVRESKPTTRFGSPAILQARANTTNSDARIFVRVPLDQIPLDGDIVLATLRFNSHAAAAGSIPARVYPVTADWKAGVRWQGQPAVGALIDTETKVDPPASSVWEWNVTAWASTRSRQGLMIDVDTATLLKLRGSSATSGQPVLVVEYTTAPDTPSTLKPSGGAVSVPRPVLTYAGDEDMTEQWVEYSTAGTTGSTVYQSGWLPSTRGYYDPTADPGTGVGKTGAIPNPAAGVPVYFRVKTRGPDGESLFSGWVSYTYQPVTNPVITNPPATTDDGTPPLVWTIPAQTSWQASLYGPDGLIENTGWRNEPDTRTWTPQKGVQVPDGQGRFVLWTTDGVRPRVSAENAPTYGRDDVVFTTALDGAGAGVEVLNFSYDEPIASFSGSRSFGVPDEIALLRDGVVVPIWASDGEPYLWAPGTLVFDDDNFAFRDYTANLRHEHTWSVVTRSDGVTSGLGPTVTRRFHTGSVWLVDPETGEQVEVFGYNGVPVIDQAIVESAAVHTPVTGGLTVETVRRRLLRTTRSGGVNGMVVNEAEGILQGWAERDSRHRYRLIFGKVNWSVIIGDYNPTDVFYSEECGDDMVKIDLNWWERLGP